LHILDIARGCILDRQRAAKAILANDGTAIAINAAAINFVIVFDIFTPLN
jgi:hypothetical protein